MDLRGRSKNKEDERPEIKKQATPQRVMRHNHRNN